MSEYTKKQLNVIALITILLNLVVFGILHVVLARAYEAGIIAVVAFGVVAGVLIALTFYLSFTDKSTKLTQYYIALTAGIFLWGLLGEIPDHYYYFDLSSWRLIPLLITAICIYLLAAFKYKIRDAITIMFTMFMMIWLWHNLMVTQFHMLGETHWSTYLGAVFCAVIGALSLRYALKSDNLWVVVALSIVSIIHFWNIVEYVQAWTGGHADHSH